MDVRNRLYSNMFFRNMIADLFGRSAGHKPGGFIPYFQYRIGPYNSDYYLYFPKEPYAIRYKNEIFNKLNEYYDADIIYFLEFHYTPYPTKQEFLKFLRYEIYGRLTRKISSQRRQKLEIARQWILEKQQELQSAERAALNKEIEQQVRKVYEDQPGMGSQQIEKAVQYLTNLLSQDIKKILDSSADRFEALTGTLPAGDIQLNNQNHREKLVQLFYLIQTIKAPSRIGKTELLFKKFNNQDLASILHLHFGEFANKKANTVEKYIRECRDLLKPENPKVKKLAEALEDFFY
jgi:hypothetical protein